MILLAVFFPLFAQSADVAIKPDGSKLAPVDQCYVIERSGKPIGLTHQVIRADQRDGERVWDIVVHQKADAMHFDLRDHFVLARRDLLPIAFDSRRSGVEHVRLYYAKGHVTGTKTGKDGPAAIDVALAGPTWEGNLWGVTFGALPLADGADLSLPFYQYDQGLGRFTLHVTGSETVTTPAGPLAAWAVDAGTGPDQRTTYLIGKADGAELGTRSPGFSTRLGGDCSAID